MDTNKIEEYARNYITSDYFANSVCMFYRHDFGLLSDEVKEKLRQEARRWYKAWSDNLWNLSYNKENK